jgi:hypothetical protein
MLKGIWKLFCTIVSTYKNIYVVAFSLDDNLTILIEECERGDYWGIFLLKRKATPDFSKLKRKETREIDLLSFSIFQRIENISRLAG